MEAHNNPQVECVYKILRACSLLLTGECEEALQWSDAAQKLLYTVGTQGLLPWPEHVFARFLILTGLPGPLPVDRRGELEAMLGQLQIWAKTCPANFEHKYALAAGELARLDGRAAEAVEFYRQAIDAAVDSGYVQWEGLARLRKARLWSETGYDSLAAIHWQEAYACYHRWGAVRKLAVMEGEFLQWMQRGATAIFDTEKGSGELREQYRESLLRVLRQKVVNRDQAQFEQEALVRAEELAQATSRLRVQAAERKRVEEELRQHREKLEVMVRRRTVELEAVAQSLKPAEPD